MPRIPTLNTKSTVSTDVPRMTATPANTASLNAMAQLGDRVAQMGAALADKRQQKIDATAELDLDLKTSNAASEFTDLNKDKIDDNGKVDGVDFKDALKSHVENVAKEVRDNNTSISGDQAFKLDQKLQIRLDSIIERGKITQDAVVSKRADFKAGQQFEKIIDSAYTGDLRSTEISLKSWDNFVTQLPNEVKQKWTEQNISDKAYTAAVEGMLNKDAISSAKQALSQVGGKISNKSRLQLENKVEQTQRIYDNKISSEVQDSVGTLSNALKMGVISSDEANAELEKIYAKSRSVSNQEMVKPIVDKATILGATIEVSQDFDSLPIEKWPMKISEAVDAISTNKDLNTRINAATLKNNLESMMVKRFEMVEKSAADYFVATDKKAKELIKTANTAEGFKEFAGYVKSRAKDFNVSDNDVKIVPNIIANRYASALESSDPALVLKSMSDLKSIMGSDFSRGVLEITKNPSIIAAANIADPQKAFNLLQDSNNKDFLKAFKDFKTTSGITTKKYNDNLNNAIKPSSQVGMLLEGLAKMPDGYKSLNSFKKAIETTYNAELMKTSGDFSAAREAVENLFTGDKGKYEVVKNTTGTNSKILLPKDNKFGINADMLNTAIDKFKANPTMFAAQLGVGAGMMKDFPTEGSFESVEFRINQTADGIKMYHADAPVRIDGKEVIIPFSEVEGISIASIGGAASTPFKMEIPNLRENAAARMYGKDWKKRMGQ